MAGFLLTHVGFRLLLGPPQSGVLGVEVGSLRQSVRILLFLGLLTVSTPTILYRKDTRKHTRSQLLVGLLLGTLLGGTWSWILGEQH